MGARPADLAEFLTHFWDDHPRELALDLLQWKTLVFVSTGSESELSYSILNAHGVEIGESRREPRPSWWAGLSRFDEIRVVVYDQKGIKRLEVVRPSGWRRRELLVYDGQARLAGTVIRTGWRRFGFLDGTGTPVGRLSRSRLGDDFDYVLEDVTGTQIAVIRDFKELIRRLPRWERKIARSDMFWLRYPEGHALEFTAPVVEAVRPLIVGAAAALYAYLQSPDPGDA